MRRIFSALDIGSGFIKIVVGEFFNGKLNILCAVKRKSKGFKNNQITNSDNLKKSILSALNEVAIKLNFKVTKVIVNIPTDYNEFIVTDSTVDVHSDNLTVTSNDILKVLQASSQNQVRANDELLATLPVIFKVGDNETLEPLGKKGSTLSLKSVLVTTDKKRVYDLVKVLEECELQIVDITTTGLVDYYNFKSRELDSKNTIVVNIGQTTTNISVFTKGIYTNNVSLDIGGDTLDKEIAVTYNIKKKEAVYLKENLALANSENALVREIITVKDVSNKDIKINQHELSILVNKKLMEMLKNIKKNINYLTKKEISYIIITGGLAELKEFVVPVNSVFGEKARIGKINEIGVRDSSYSVAIGMLKFFNSKLLLRGKNYTMVSDEDIESMCENSNKSSINGDSLIGKVVSYFFDN